MEPELMRREHFEWEGERYLVQVSRRPQGHPRCLYMAVTVLGPDDCIIHDGASVAEVLHRQRTMLPLALLSRAIAAGTVSSTSDAVPVQEVDRLEKSPSARQDRRGRAAKRSDKPSGRGQSHRRPSGKVPENGLHLHAVPYGSNNTWQHPSA
jgi:hypothetical protein